MRLVMLSAGAEISVYSVPNDVAENLGSYCVKFGEWVATSPDADKFRIKYGDSFYLDYTEKDFIDYLNEYVCGTRSRFVTVISNVLYHDEVPKRFRKLPYFYF